MKREQKVEKRLLRSRQRAKKNGDRNRMRMRTSTGMDCPYDVDMNGSYGTCHCGGRNYNDCLGDI